jgi:hypothetical protein
MRRLKEISLQADEFTSDKEIEALLISADSDKRLLATFTKRKKIETNNGPRGQHFGAAKEMIDDADSDCTWQAFIIIGEFLRSKPYDCWEIILEYGDSGNPDTRAVVATVLLEHFFEQNPDLFDEIFITLKQYVLDGHRNLLHTIRLCRSGWGGEINKIKIDKFSETQT